MSRSGYVECGDIEDNWGLIRYRGAVNSAIKGKRGQKLLKELLNVLDNMDEKKLVDCSNEFSFEINGQYCALGALANSRGLDVSEINPENAHIVGETFGIAESLAREIMYMNDEHPTKWNEKDSDRWLRVRMWVASLINEVNNE